MAKSGHIVDLQNLPEEIRQGENLAIWNQVLDYLPSNTQMQPWTFGVTVISTSLTGLKPTLPDGIDHNKIPLEVRKRAVTMSALGQRKWLEEWINSLPGDEPKKLKISPACLSDAHLNFWIPIDAACPNCGQTNMRAQDISQPYRYETFCAKCGDCETVSCFEMTGYLRGCQLVAEQRSRKD
jgi:hypothetical protein